WDAVNAAHVNPTYPLSLDQSATALQVQVDVVAGTPPTLDINFTTALQFQRNRNVYDVITFNDLMNCPTVPVNIAGPPAQFAVNDLQGFQIDTIINGSLQISHDGGQNWSAAPAGTIVYQAHGAQLVDDQLRWLDSPLPSPLGVRNAFTVSAYDGTLNLAGGE